jgi:hypothetical protein
MPFGLGAWAAGGQTEPDTFDRAPFASGSVHGGGGRTALGDRAPSAHPALRAPCVRAAYQPRIVRQYAARKLALVRSSPTARDWEANGSSAGGASSS